MQNLQTNQSLVDEAGRFLRSELAVALPKLTEEQLRHLNGMFGLHLHELHRLSHQQGNEVAALLKTSLKTADMAWLEINVQDQKRRKENGTLFK